MIFLYNFLYKRKVTKIVTKTLCGNSAKTAAGQPLVNSWSIVFKINTRLATLYFIVIYNILYHIN